MAEAQLKFVRPSFVSYPDLRALRRLIRFGVNFWGPEKTLGHMLDFILSVALLLWYNGGKILQKLAL